MTEFLEKIYKNDYYIFAKLENVLVNQDINQVIFGEDEELIVEQILKYCENNSLKDNKKFLDEVFEKYTKEQLITLNESLIIERNQLVRFLAEINNERKDLRKRNKNLTKKLFENQMKTDTLDKDFGDFVNKSIFLNYEFLKNFNQKIQIENQKILKELEDKNKEIDSLKEKIEKLEVKLRKERSNFKFFITTGTNKEDESLSNISNNEKSLKISPNKPVKNFNEKSIDITSQDSENIQILLPTPKGTNKFSANNTKKIMNVSNSQKSLLLNDISKTKAETVIVPQTTTNTNIKSFDFKKTTEKKQPLTKTSKTKIIPSKTTNTNKFKKDENLNKSKIEKTTTLSKENSFNQSFSKDLNKSNILDAKRNPVKYKTTNLAKNVSSNRLTVKK